MSPSAPRRRKVIAFPKTGIAYCEQLYRTLSERGVLVLEGVWHGAWILRYVRPGDVVHVHWPSFHYHVWGKRLTTLYRLARFFCLTTLIRTLGARIVWTAHNLYPHDGARGQWTHRIARRRIVRAAERIFVHGPSAARLIVREFHVDVARIREIPHGHWCHLYSPPLEKAAARRALGLPPDARIYGFVGSCRPYKNIEAIIDAFLALRDSTHLVIAGHFSSPAYLDSIRARVSAESIARVHFIARYLEDGEILTIVAALDALVLAYQEILTSGAVMLGLSAGVPVVAPGLGCIPDVVDASVGVLYDPAVAGALSAAMREVLGKSYDRDAIVAHALSFDWSLAAAAIVEVLESP